MDSNEDAMANGIRNERPSPRPRSNSPPISAGRRSTAIGGTNNNPREKPSPPRRTKTRTSLIASNPPPPPPPLATTTTSNPSTKSLEIAIKTIEQLQNKLVSANLEVEAAVSKNKSLVQENSKAKNKIKTLESQIGLNVKKKVESFEKKVPEKELREVEVKLQECKVQLEGAKIENHKLQSTCSEQDALILELQLSQESLTSTNEQLGTKLTDTEAKLSNALSLLSQSQQFGREMKSSLVEMKSSCLSEVSGAMSQLREYQQKTSSQYDISHHNLTTSLAAAQDTLSSVNRELAAEKAKGANALAAYSRELGEHTRHIASLEKMMAKSRSEVETLKNIRRGMARELSSHKSGYESSEKSLSKLKAELKESNRREYASRQKMEILQQTRTRELETSARIAAKMSVENPDEFALELASDVNQVNGMLEAYRGEASFRIASLKNQCQELQRANNQLEEQNEVLEVENLLALEKIGVL